MIGSGRYLNLFLDLSFRARGLVRKWRYFADRPGEFVASVWRPLGNDAYQLVDRDYIVAGDSGLGVSASTQIFDLHNSMSHFQ